MNKAAQLSLVIPCYNESRNIPKLFENLIQNPKDQLELMELILIDNGSTDNSRNIMENELKKYSFLNCKIIRIETNQGYGHGIVTGLKQASAEVLAWTHADLQTDLADVTRAFKILKSHPNYQNVFLKGRRQNRPLIDSFFTMGMSAASSLLLKTKLDDINAQPKMFHRNFFNMLKNFPDDFSLDLYFYLMAKRSRLSILTIPVIYKVRLAGEAKGGGSLKNKFKLTQRTFNYILKLQLHI